MKSIKEGNCVLIDIEHCRTPRLTTKINTEYYGL